MLNKKSKKSLSYISERLKKIYRFSSIIIDDSGIITFENCKGIVHYSSNVVVVLFNDDEISIYGSELLLQSVARGTVVVSGKIDEIKFQKKG